MKAKLSVFAIAVIIIISTAWIAPVSNTTTGNKPVKVSPTLNTSFSFVRAHRQGKGITATWGITSTDGVTGFIVQKTYEDPTDPYAFWEDLCSLPCNPSRSFKHTDNSVFPGYINYRIIAQMDNGSDVMSETVTVRIVQH